MRTTSLKSSRVKQTLRRKEDTVSRLKQKNSTVSYQSNYTQTHQETTSTSTQYVTNTQDKNVQCNLVRNDIEQLKDEIYYWQTEALENNNKKITVSNFETKCEGQGSPFCDKVRLAVTSCITSQVPRQNISTLISSIINIFTGIELKNMPSE